jgi:hypothetical protein
MDIAITKDSFKTLVNIVIFDLIHINLVQCASITITHAMIVVTQNKAQSSQNECQEMISFPLP